jgi:hypothetical protein
MLVTVWDSRLRTWGTLWECWKLGEISETGGKLGEGWGQGGLRVGPWTHFSVGHCRESGPSSRRVLEILVCLSLGTGRLAVFNWEMEKWFHSRFGDEGFGLMDRRVGFWIGFGGVQRRRKK